MSVITEFNIFPLGVEKGLSIYVQKVIGEMRKAEVPYSLTSMGTIYETDTFEQALVVLQNAYACLEEDSSRIYCSAKFDISKKEGNRMESKISSVEAILK